MDIHNQASAIILVASDITTDAVLVRNLLKEEFNHVFTSTDPNLSAGDFARYQPDVLVLVFNTLEKSERYYLGLYRLCQEIHQRPHRTIILCNKDEVKRAYELCKKGYFDDYIMFWPMTFDTSRLLMSVHAELRELATFTSEGLYAVEFAAQARRLAELEKMLEPQVAQNGCHIEAANMVMERAEQGIGADSGRLISGVQSSQQTVKNSDELQNDISRFRREERHPHFHAAAESVQPTWTQKLKQECELPPESTGTLHAMAERISPVVLLVVDDDEFQRKIIGKLLKSENYRLIFAANGAQALSVLRKTQPDIILMDVMMPDIDGIEVTRYIREVGKFARTPVIMITGNSDEKVVIDCMAAGATDFVVKPLDRDTLIAKITRALRASADLRMVRLAVPHQYDGLVSYKGDVMAPNTISSGTSASISASTSANTSENKSTSENTSTSTSTSSNTNTNTNTNTSSNSSLATGAVNASGSEAPARPESRANTTGSAGATGQQIPQAEQGQNIGSNINIKV